MQKKHFEEQRNFRLQQAELMALFAEADPDPVFRFSLSGEILMANKAGTILLANKIVVGMNICSLIPELNAIDLSKCIKNGKQVVISSKLDDKVYNFTICGLPKFDIGQIYGSDITELKDAEVKITSALFQSEKSEKMKSYFLSQMSHEIRSPLTALLGFSSIIKDELKHILPKEMEYALMAIENTGKRIYRTIDLNLNMAQLLAGDFKLTQQKILINDAIHPLLLEFNSAAKEKSINLVFEDATDNRTIWFDLYSFNLILQNLLDNAVKYTRDGSIKIFAYLNTSEEICLDVTDTGIGISEEYIDLLFTPFTQEVMGYSRPYEGNGLGLALVKRLVDLNNSQINVTSKKNMGSTFTLIFNKKNEYK